MFGNSSLSSSSTPIVGVIPLRLGAGLTLLYMHAWEGAIQAWQHLWNQVPWETIGIVEKAGLPVPHALAIGAAAIAAFTGASWVLGFATRFASFVFLPVALGSLLVANRTEQSIAAETCLLYVLIALTLLVSGSGWLSVDSLFDLGKGKKPKKGGYV
ncbi:MAG: TQO small subunit DoxD [Roseimicrobium sp.]